MKKSYFVYFHKKVPAAQDFLILFFSPEKNSDFFAFSSCDFSGSAVSHGSKKKNKILSFRKSVSLISVIRNYFYMIFRF